MIQTSGVKIPNSVLVSGLIDTEADEDLYDFLKQYGSIQRKIPIDLPQSEPGLQVIIEFTYGTALQSLSSILPYKLASKTQSLLTISRHWQVFTLLMSANQLHKSISQC